MSRPIVVQKLGGTSLATTDLVVRAAQRAVAARRAGADVVLVVSAFAGETDRLLGLARRLSPRASARELDVVAATGEQVSAGLMALALQALDAPARSFLGHQVPIRTDGVFGDAQIVATPASRLHACLAAGEIPVVAGFQGVDEAGNVTTLGRGGSDTTAVAVAAALGATCEIYTDVDGVHSIDPRLSSAAVRLDFIGYRTMRAFAAAGAKVLEPRSAALAALHRVEVHVRSSFGDGLGTWVVDDEDPRAAAAFGVAVGRRYATALGAEVGVIGTRVRGRDPRDGNARLARAGIAVLAARRTDEGHAFVVNADHADDAARLLHGIHAADDERPASWRRIGVDTMTPAFDITPAFDTVGGRN